MGLYLYKLSITQIFKKTNSFQCKIMNNIDISLLFLIFILNIKTKSYFNQLLKLAIKYDTIPLCKTKKKIFIYF